MIAKRHLIFGLYIDAVHMEDVIDQCQRAILARRRLLLGVLNAAKVVTLRKNKVLRDAILDCDLVLADGQAVVWASKLLRKPLPERIAGIDIFERLLQLANEQELSIALLGATPEVLKKVEGAIANRFPRAKIAYRHHGFYKPGEAGQIAVEIAASKADMLFLGIASPKKEIFLATYGSHLDVPVLHGVGGSFDIMAGVTARAPASWQKAGLEWAYRLLQEPQRLWWRYLTTNLGFIRLTLTEMLVPTGAYRAGRRRSRRQMSLGLAARKLQGGADE